MTTVITYLEQDFSIWNLVMSKFVVKYLVNISSFSGRFAESNICYHILHSASVSSPHPTFICLL